jgi:intracellular sulfur oxidation DsrE/DsrF family protein
MPRQIWFWRGRQCFFACLIFNVNQGIKMKQMSHLARTLLLSTLMATAISMPAIAAQPAPAPQIRIDVPVALKQAKVVFNLDHAAFSGDTPVGLKHMTLMLERFKQNGTESSLVAVFHGDAGYMLLNDEAYNAARKTNTGNPYKGTVENLIKQGVQIEECVVTMKANKWGNENLLSGVKVNSGALGRIVQLVQEGYVMIQP